MSHVHRRGLSAGEVGAVKADAEGAHSTLGLGNEGKLGVVGISYSATYSECGRRRTARESRS